MVGVIVESQELFLWFSVESGVDCAVSFNPNFRVEEWSVVATLREVSGELK